MLSELDNYLQRIEDLRRQVSDLVTGLSTQALNWRPTDAPPLAGEAGRGTEEHASNSLAILVAHIAGAEHFWIAEVIGNRPPTRDRAADFAIQATDASELCLLLERTASETREVLSALSDADLDGVREVEGRVVPVRWGILHVIDHTALHLGHMQITYQLWKGGQSKPSPFWFERLPSGKNSAEESG